MADWPDLAALKALLDVSSDDWDDRLQSVLDAAIARVKIKVGAWDEDTDAPNEQMAEAALLAASRIAKAPSEAAARDPKQIDVALESLLVGQRREFGVG